MHRFEVEGSRCAVASLEMSVEVVDGAYVVDAPWLEEPETKATFEEAYWACIAKRTVEP